MARVLFVFLLLGAIMAEPKEREIHSGMNRHFGASDAESVQDDFFEADRASGADAMRRSGLPDQDTFGEDGQGMKAFSEDSIGTGGAGEQMKLSGTSAAPAIEDANDAEEPAAVSTDMLPEAGALNGVFNAKQTQLENVRVEIEQSKTTVDKQATEAKRLIKEAYEKQSNLRDLQSKITEQSLALEKQRHELETKQGEIDKLKAELEARIQQLNSQSNKADAQESMSVAIQTQLKELDDKKASFEVDESSKEAELEKLKESLTKTKFSLEERASEVSQKESDVKKLYDEINSLTKTTQLHEAHVRQQEQETLKREAALKEKEAELTKLRTHLASANHQLSKSRAEELVGTQTAIQTALELTMPMNDLSEEGIAVIGGLDDTGILDQIKKQPAPQIQPLPSKKTPITVVIPESEIKVVDRSTRTLETFLDSRPSTYGQKELVGQKYSASYIPAGDDPRDPDGRCRNSRGDEVACEAIPSLKTDSVPLIVPSVETVLGNGEEFAPETEGPCVLKCAYHKGPSAAVGSKNIEELSIPIPTHTAVNSTYGCPRTNNGYPFLSCSLMTDNSGKCKSTCVFDGDANPLKPKMFGIGLPLTGKDGFKFNPEEFRSLAHTTYEVETTVGCRSSMKADPLVACEVKL